MHCHWLMTSFPVRTTAHQHIRGVLWSVLSLCPTHTFIYQRPHLTLLARVTAALITLSARSDKWAQSHFTILHYHAACRSCPKNRMWSHLHCCVQKKQTKNNPMMQLSFPFNLLTVFDCYRLCSHGIMLIFSQTAKV